MLTFMRFSFEVTVNVFEHHVLWITTLIVCFCLQDLNVDEFEEMFKTKAQGPAIDMTMQKQKAPQKGPNKVSLLEANRAKNLAITLRKAGKSPEEICKAIQT